jgi:hypothetical protein
MGVSALATSGLLTLSPRAFAAATTTGAWSAPFDLGGFAIHAALLHTDDVLYFQYVEGDPTVDHTSLIKSWNVDTKVSVLRAIGYHRDLFCSGMNVLSDGRLFVAGGHDETTGLRTDYRGIKYTDLYDPETHVWTPGPELSRKRWYPTAVGMPNGHTYVFGGGEERGIPSTTLDDFDPLAGTMTRRPDTATKNLGNYPRLHLLADGNVLKTGPSARSLVFRPATDTWANSATVNYGARINGSSVMLPDLKRQLVFGGQALRGRPATATAEILDTSASTWKWRYTAPLTTARIHANAVLLPDGNVLAIGGGTGPGRYQGPVMMTEMFDPAAETWTVMASQQAQRMYHATALLLPDGRVLSAGSNSGTQGETGEIYSPPYLFRGPRPTLTSAPTAVGYGDTVAVVSPDLDLARLVLVHPGALTHQVDTAQRHVLLTFTSNGAGVYTAQIPMSSNVAPAGYYMLFAVNADGVPSVASWVKVG